MKDSFLTGSVYIFNEGSRRHFGRYIIQALERSEEYGGCTFYLCISTTIQLNSSVTNVQDADVIFQFSIWWLREANRVSLRKVSDSHD